MSAPAPTPSTSAATSTSKPRRVRPSNGAGSEAAALRSCCSDAPIAAFCKNKRRPLGRRFCVLRPMCFCHSRAADRSSFTSALPRPPIRLDHAKTRCGFTATHPHDGARVSRRFAGGLGKASFSRAGHLSCSVACSRLSRSGQLGSDTMTCVFVHVPKCAGQSVEMFFLNRIGLDWERRAPLLLRPNDVPALGPHLLAHLKAHEYVEKKWMTPLEFNEYFKFAFVRNPWGQDRLVLSLPGL